MRSLLTVIIVGLSLSMSACVTPGAMKQDNSLMNKKIAIVSELGNSFRNNVVGTTVFSNASTNSDVTDWQINTLATSIINNRLQAKSLSGTVVETNFFPAIQDESWSTIFALSDSVIPKIKGMGFDSLILVKPASMDSDRFYRPGYGQHARYFFGRKTACLYAVYVVEIYDLQTEKLVAWEWMNGRKGQCESKTLETFPLKDNFEDYTEQEKALIRDRMQRLISTTLNRTLDVLKLH